MNSAVVTEDGNLLALGNWGPDERQYHHTAGFASNVSIMSLGLQIPESCMVKVDENKLFVIGGRQKTIYNVYESGRQKTIYNVYEPRFARCDDGPTYNSTYIFDLSNMTYTVAADLSIERRSHECAMFKHNGRDIIVIAGGTAKVGTHFYDAYSRDDTQSVELLDLSNPTTWIPGNIIPSMQEITSIFNTFCF